MSNLVTVENGLTGHFKQATGRSRYGIDWAVRIKGARDGVVIVRTYFSSDMPQETEKKTLADKAVQFVQRKLQQGWLPWAGVLEYEDEWPNKSLQAMRDSALSSASRFASFGPACLSSGRSAIL